MSRVQGQQRREFTRCVVEPMTRAQHRWRWTRCSSTVTRSATRAEDLVTSRRTAGETRARAKDSKGKGGKKGKGKIRSHFGSSHFLFECELCFSRSRAFLVLSCPSVYYPVLYFLILFHGTCERRNRCASFSSTSLLFEYGFSSWFSRQYDGGENQRNVHTNRKIADTHAEYIQIRKLLPDALPDSGFI